VSSAKPNSFIAAVRMVPELHVSPNKSKPSSSLP
jgi:hypothetical protein